MPTERHPNGALDQRPELARALDHLRAGDTLMVWLLDRLGRSLRHTWSTRSPPLVVVSMLS